MATNYKEKSFKYLEYLQGAELAGSEGYPILKPTHSIPENVISFNEWRSCKHEERYWVDHFIDDSNFNCVYNNLFRYAAKCQKAKGVIGTDFSAYRNMPAWQRKGSVGKNRTIDYILQTFYGVDVIPVVSFAYLYDLDWSLAGIPFDSSIAISTNGSVNNFVSRNTFIEGVMEVNNRIKPRHIIIAGGPVPELDETLSNVVYYPNFSQRLHARRKNNG